MQTVVLPSSHATSAWLEFDADSRGPARRVQLESLPLVLGRGDTADCQVVSNCVSREHAAITGSASGFRIRDLGSTNGTYVNGEKVAESPLEDGDSVRLGNFEFLFRADNVAGPSRAETLLMESDETHLGSVEANDAVHTLRRIQETLLCGCFPIRWREIVHTADQAPVGRALRSPVDSPQMAAAASQGLATGASPGTFYRFRLHYRLAAARQFTSPRSGSWFVMQVASSELDSVPSLCQQLEVVVASLPRSVHPVLEIPANYHLSPDQRDDLSHFVRRTGTSLGLGGFLGGPAGLLELEDLAPAFLSLSARLVSDAHREAHHRRQLAALRATCERMECRLLVEGNLNDDEWSFCLENALEYVVRDAEGGSRTSFLFDVVS